MSKRFMVRSVLAAGIVGAFGLAACENKPEPAKPAAKPAEPAKPSAEPAKAPEKK